MSKLTLIKSLVFEGGSVKGLTYVGALDAIDRYFQSENSGQRFLQGIVRVAGTSAGAIMALLIAIGLGLEQITVIMRSTSFSSFADMGWSTSKAGNIGKAYAVYNKGYVCEGNEFYRWVRNLLFEHFGKEDFTFEELYEKTQKSLHVFAVRVNDSKVVEFNHTTTPKVSVALAVRMSMSIPVFFKPVRVDQTLDKDGFIRIATNETGGTTYYIDGGVKANYPFAELRQRNALFPEQKDLDYSTMLGFKVGSDIERMLDKAAANQIEQSFLEGKLAIEEGFVPSFVLRILPVVLSPQEDQHRRDRLQMDRTIHCSDLGISTLKFDLTAADIMNLTTSGANAAMQFLSVDAAKMPQKQVSSAAVKSFEKDYVEKEIKRGRKVTKAIVENVTKNGAFLSPGQKVSVQHLIQDLQRLEKTAIHLCAPEDGHELAKYTVPVGRAGKTLHDGEENLFQHDVQFCIQELQQLLETLPSEPAPPNVMTTSETVVVEKSIKTVVEETVDKGTKRGRDDITEEEGSAHKK